MHHHKSGRYGVAELGNQTTGHRQWRWVRWCKTPNQQEQVFERMLRLEFPQPIIRIQR